MVFTDFQRFGLPKDDPKAMPKKTSEKRLSKIDVDLHLGLPKPPEIAPKSSRDAKKMGLGRSLFCDAMQTASKSARVSGAQRFATVSLVFQRIRSALSVSLLIAPRRHNPQRNFFDGSRKSIKMHSNFDKILQIFIKTEQKSTQNR